MANETLITDLVSREAIEQLERLDRQMDSTLVQFRDCAREMAKGIKIPVEVQGDVEKLKQIYETQMRGITAATQQYTQQAQQQQRVVEETTRAISDNARAQRESTETNRQALATAERVLGTTEEHYRRLAELTKEMKANKDARKEVDKAEKEGTITTEQAIAKRASLLKKYDEMKVESQQLGRELSVEVKRVSEVEGSYNNLSQELEHLKQAYKKMSEEERNSAAGKELLNKIQTLDKNLKTLAGDMGEFQRNVGNYQNSILGAIGINGKLGDALIASGGNVKSFGAVIKTEAAAINTALKSLLANPVFLAVLGIVGAGAAFKFWADYNDGLSEATRLTREFTGYSGEQLAELRAEIQATAEVMDKEYVDVLKTADALMAHFHITGAEAMDVINKGFAAGADLNGDFLSKIQQMSGRFHDAGVSAQEMVAIITQTRSGIFSDDGLAVIAKAGQQIRLMSKNTRESLTAIGVDANKMQQELTNGNITVFQAIQQVSGALKEIPANSQEAAEVIKNVFGKVGLASSQEMIKSLQDMETNLDKVAETTGDYGKLLLEQIKINKELEAETADLFGVTGGGWEEVKMKADIYWSYVLKAIVNWYQMWKKVWKYEATVIADIYTGIHSIGSGLIALGKGTVDLAKTALQSAKDIAGAFADVGNILGNIAKGDFDAAGQRWDMLKNKVISVTDAVKGLRGAFFEAFSTTRNADKAKFNDLIWGGDSDFSNPNAGGGAGGVGGADNEETNLGNGGGKSGGGSSKNIVDERKKLAEQLANDARKVEEQSMTESREKINEHYDGLEKEIRTKYAGLKNMTAEEQEQLNTLIEANTQKRNEALAKFDEDVAKKKKEAADKEIADLQSQYAAEQAMADVEYTEELTALEQMLAQKLISREEYEMQVADITEEYAQETIRRQIESIQKQLAVADLSVDEREKLEQQLSKAQADLAKQEADAEIEEIERVTEADEKARQKRLNNMQAWVDKAGEALGQIAAFASAMFDNQIAKVQEEIDTEKESYDERVAQIEDLAERGVISQEEAEIRKRDALAETQRKQEALDKRKKELAYKQAIIEKANNVAQIGIATALGIMNAWTAPFPINTWLPGMVAAMGAIQVATALAQPIKAYKEGTKDKPHPGGLAVVGDGGKPEIITFGGRAYITPDSPTLVDLPKGAEVLPDASKVETLAGVINNIPRDRNSNQPVIINDYDALEARMANNTKQMVKSLGILGEQMKREMRRQKFRNYINERT